MESPKNGSLSDYPVDKRSCQLLGPTALVGVSVLHRELNKLWYMTGGASVDGGSCNPVINLEKT